VLLYAGILLIGLGAGIASGLFGIGGGVVIIPAMVLIARLDQHTAVGTSLAALLLPVGILGVVEYWRRDQMNLVYAALLAAGLLVGVLLGAKFAGKLDDLTLRRAFAVFLLVVAARMLLTKR